MSKISQNKGNPNRDLLLFQIQRHLSGFAKATLVILEDLNLPPDEFQKLRKKILDHSGESSRELTTFVEKFF